MNSRNFFKKISLLTFIIFFLHILATKFFWYWKFWWFDILMHFLGGIFISLFLLWFFYFKKKFIDKKLFLFSLIGIILISFLWEIFELSLDRFLIKENLLVSNILDTVSDIFMDFSGAILGIFYFFKNVIIKNHG